MTMPISPIYLDNAATTPVDPRVAARMIPFLHEQFGNPASRGHAFGWAAERAVEAARAQVAALVGAAPAEIVFTSGATESINLALKGAAHGQRARGRHLLSVRTEHPAALDSLAALEREGFEVTLLEVDAGGLLDPRLLEAALRPDTVLVSVMLVNNEIGVIQDVAAIGALLRTRGIPFHVDAAQAAGKLPVDLSTLPVDLMSLSAHKAYGPKGVGALYLRRGAQLRIEPQMHGGGHERGLRSGTLAPHQLAGFGEAFRIAAEEMAAECARIRRLRDRLWRGLAGIGGVRLNGHPERRVPHNLNLSFDGIEDDSLAMALDTLAVSSGAACRSASLEPSHVLRALGCGDARARGAIRFGLGRFTTEAEIDAAVARVAAAVAALRGGAPGQPPQQTEGARAAAR